MKELRTSLINFDLILDGMKTYCTVNANKKLQVGETLKIRELLSSAKKGGYVEGPRVLFVEIGTTELLAGSATDGTVIISLRNARLTEKAPPTITHDLEEEKS